MIVAKRFGFDAAHFLPNYEGKCKELHGHHWVVELAVEGEVNEKSGMVIDFVLLKEFLKVVETTFDHKLLNNIISNPTAENLCLWIKCKFEDYCTQTAYMKGIKLSWIKVWETGDSYALLSY